MIICESYVKSSLQILQPYNCITYNISNKQLVGVSMDRTLKGSKIKDVYEKYEVWFKKTERIVIKGSRRKFIANKLGLSIQQTDRYKKLGDLIHEIREMVFEGILGMSCAQEIASRPEYEQREIYSIMEKAQIENIEFTRNLMKKIVFEYQSGKLSWPQIKSSIYKDTLDSSFSPETKEKAIINIFDPSLYNSASKAETGRLFREYIAELLVLDGFINVRTTQDSYDYGVDIYGIRDRESYVFQVKYHSNQIQGPEAIKEVLKGKEKYNVDTAVVITNTEFSDSAKTIARSEHVLLWDGIFLYGKIQEFTKENSAENKAKYLVFQ